MAGVADSSGSGKWVKYRLKQATKASKRKVKAYSPKDDVPF